MSKFYEILCEISLTNLRSGNLPSKVTESNHKCENNAYSKFRTHLFVQRSSCLPLHVSPPAAEPAHARSTAIVGKTPTAAKIEPKYDTPGED